MGGGTADNTAVVGGGTADNTGNCCEWRYRRQHRKLLRVEVL